MFKLIFDLATEPLGLPIAWYYEWIILGIIETLTYFIAYSMVGDLYHTHIISGRTAGSFFHWVIKTFCFMAIWAITYGVICVGKFVVENKVVICVATGSVLLLVIIARLLLRNIRYKAKERSAKEEIQ